MSKDYKLTSEDWDNLTKFFELLIEADQEQRKIGQSGRILEEEKH